MPFFRTTDGAEIAFEERGRGALAFLFVHGWQADRSVWDGVIAALSPQVRCVAVDLRGSGDSRTAPGPFSLERFAADLRELIDGLAIRPAIVVGHSMGATVGLRLAVDSPQAVRGLVLVAPVPASGAGFTAAGAQYLRTTVGDPAAARKWLARTFSKEPDARTLDLLCEAAARTSREAAMESFAAWSNADFAEETRSVRLPAVVVAPAHDTPEMYERKVAALLPNARFAILPDCAHYAILEQPAALAEIVASLDSV